MNINFFHKITKPLNYIIPKRNAIYAVPLTNCRKDHYDLINYSSDNLLCVIRYLYMNKSEIDITIYLECFSEERLPIIQKFIDENKKGNMIIIPVISHITLEHPQFSVSRAIKNVLLRFKCRLWLADTGHVNFYEKVHRQKYYVMNYSTPFKKEEGIDEKHNFLNIDGYVHTSELCAHYLSAEYIANYWNSLILGFPRNDTLFHEENKDAVISWINSKTTARNYRIIVYAPTYREYPEAFAAGVFGFHDEEGIIEKYLRDNNIIVISKMHPRQKIDPTGYTDHVIAYETTYDFSLYDLMAISDLLISDYSSLIHDYIITGKKVVLDWFDADKYDEIRGFAFDPVESICPGPIAKTRDELITYVDVSLNDKSISKEQQRVSSDFHKFLDDNSTKRVADYLTMQITSKYKK